MKKDSRIKRHYRIRSRVVGTPQRPRLAVFRSTKHIYAQIIDDIAGKTLVFGSDAKLSERSSSATQNKMSKIEKAFQVGKELAEKALKQKITTVVFDRGGYLYHGRVLKLAEGAREGGLKF